MSEPSEATGPAYRDRVLGCLLGGAVGDALGAPVEFLPWRTIRANYGEAGIRNFAIAYGVVGAITDDTQMTLFTAEGLIRADVRARERGVCDPASVVWNAYQRWLATQGEPALASALWPDARGWLVDVPELRHRRAPGNTCLAALRSMEQKSPVADNNSKGCGGVMRVAPVGFMAGDPYDLGCQTAALTHGNPAGQEPAGLLALVISKLMRGLPMQIALVDACREAPCSEALKPRILRAVELGAGGDTLGAAFAELGEGWVADEALALAVFACVRGGSLEEAVVIAANHSGDTDSTASIAGQLAGCEQGSGAIPARWLGALEGRATIERLANDLADRFGPPPPSRERTDDEWWADYPGC